jgi:surfactin synthase thioesterase subunit
MESQKIANSWLLSYPEDKDKIRLFCLPYAGGGASIYRGWVKAFPDDVGIYPIQLPGRENRITEPPLYEMRELVEGISEAILPYLRRPFILFGHSIGARIAFELARNLREKWDIRPCCLIVSGSRAPHISEPKPLHHLPDDEFIMELRRFSGTPEAILQSRELMEIFIPTLRADFTVDETYVYSAAAPIECPISVFGGTEDTETNREELGAWACHTSGDFTLEMIEGGHFFLQTGRDSLLRSVTRILRQHL